MMNLLHFMYGVGAIVSPKVTGFITNPSGANFLWQYIYLFTIPLILIFFIPSIFTRFPDLEHNKNDKADSNDQNSSFKNSFLIALKTPAVWAFGIILGMMISLEMSSSTWGGLYFQDLYGMDPSTKGANFISTFYIFFTISRLVSGFLIEKIGYMRSLFGAIIIGIIIYIISFSLGAAGIYILPFQGFLFSIFWPTLLAVGIVYFGKDAPLMTSAIIAIAGLVNSGINYIMSRFNTWFGTGWGFRSCLLFAVVLLILLLVLNQKIKKRTQTEQSLKLG